MKDIRGALWGLLPDSIFADLAVPLLQSDIYFQDSPDDPSQDRPFAIIMFAPWQVIQRDGSMCRRPFSVWVHYYRRQSVDHLITQNILGRVIDALVPAVNVTGDDGTLTSVDLTEISGDLTDEGFQTIVNYASFNAGAR